MATWRELAADNRTAAYELFAAKRWRSFASRAYFAAYAEITHGLHQAGVNMPVGKKNPKHTTLPTIVGYHLAPLRMQDRWRLAGIVRALYRFGITADYRAEVTFERADARIAMGMMTKAFEILKGVP